MNKIVLIGRLAVDPELKTTTSGLSVTSFTIAVDRKGSTDKVTDWIDIVAWRKTAEFICNYFKKGSPIVIDGNLQTRMWEDKDGKKRKTVEVIAERVEFVPRSGGEQPQETTQSVAHGSNEDFMEIEDEDLPF